MLSTKDECPPGGDPDKAEFMAAQARSWYQQGYPVQVIKDAIKKAMKAIPGHEALPVERYAFKILVGWAAKQDLPLIKPALLPSQINAPKIHRAPPKPPFNDPKPEGN
jgi:hypothetical protein